MFSITLDRKLLAEAKHKMMILMNHVPQALAERKLTAMQTLYVSRISDHTVCTIN